MKSFFLNFYISVQCDRDLSGPALIFDFNLTYSINRICQSQKCLNETFAEIYEQFQSVPSLLVDFNNTQRELLLRSFDVIPYSGKIVRIHSILYIIRKMACVIEY
jgi:hypothetical protein